MTYCWVSTEVTRFLLAFIDSVYYYTEV